MGRPEKPLNSSIPRHLAELSEVLRAQRRATGRTFAELAENTTVSAATLKRAASASSVPRIETLQQFYVACRPHLPREQHVPTWKTALEHWQLARMEERGTLHARGARLDYIADSRDLSRVLQLFWEKKGAPSSRFIQKNSDDRVVLPLTSLERILRRESFPQSKRQLMAIVRGCFPTKLEEKKWEAAWEKVFQRMTPTSKMYGDIGREGGRARERHLTRIPESIQASRVTRMAERGPYI